MGRGQIRTEIETKMAEPVAIKDTTIELLDIAEDQILDMADELEENE